MVTVRLSIAIMGHPSRADMIRTLKAKLEAEGGRVAVSMDIWNRGIWPNAKNAWMMFDRKATHHMVINDDAILCNHFVEAVLQALQCNPNELVSWYGNASYMGKAVSEGQHWITCKNGAWGLCLSMPVRMIMDFILWEQQHFIQSGDSKEFQAFCDDTRIGLFLRDRGLNAWMCAPCLVQHGGVRNSILKHNTPNSYAKLFCTDPSPHLWDWSIPEKPYHSSVSILQNWQKFYIP